MSTAEVTAARIEKALEGFENPERRSVMAGGYAPSALRWVGASVPQWRSVVREYSAVLKSAPAGDVRALALRLVRGNIAEARHVARELIGRRRDVRSALTRLQAEALGRGNDNWASVDSFSVTIAGPAWMNGQVSDADVMRWARSKDPWWRRTALASTVALNLRSRGGTGDAPRTLRICRQLAADRHPLVVKAVSWALRSLVHHDPGAVKTFLEKHRSSLAPLVLREVGTKLTTGRKQG